MPSFSRDAYDHIRAKLAQGLAGGSELSEPTLARELGISRTPIREAIRQLESEGLLEQRPKQGTFVRQADRRELDEIYEVRLLIEPFAASRAARDMTDEKRSEVETCVRQMSAILERARERHDESAHAAELANYAVLDTTLHEILVVAAGNRRMQKIILDARVLTQAMAFPQDSPLGALASMERAHEEHERIAGAIARRDARGARQAMQQHLKRARKSALAYFDWLDKAGR
jgi:DNA-binding GntR family transcriptional regulator